MILDTLEHAVQYEALHPLFKVAFDFLRGKDLVSLPVGKITLRGDDLFVNVVDITAKPMEEVKMETHQRYIDIQMPVGQMETMGWRAADKLQRMDEPYDAERDIAFYGDCAAHLITVQPYEFVVFFPQDGHQPGIGQGTYRKIIVKIKA